MRVIKEYRSLSGLMSGVVIGGLVFLAVGLVTPVARGQGAGPTPSPQAAPAYDSFSVDSSTTLTITYNLGDFKDGRFPVTDGQPADGAQLVLNVAANWSNFRPVDVKIDATFGKANVPLSYPLKGIKWDATKKQYTAAKTDLAGLATYLIDQINKLERDFNAGNPIPSTSPVTLTITVEGDGVARPSTLKPPVVIAFQLVPAAAAAAAQGPVTVDASTKLAINYSLGDFKDGRFPVINGQPGDGAQLVLNVSADWKTTLPVDVKIDATFGKANVPLSYTLKGVKWDATNKHYTAQKADLTAFASSLIDQINKVESGFNADNPIPSTGPVTLTITPQGAGAPPPSTLKTTTVPITFQLVAAATQGPVTVDASTKLAINYSLGDFQGGRFPVINGQPGDGVQLVLNVSADWKTTLPVDVKIDATFGKANVPLSYTLKGVKWDATNKHYTAQKADLTAFASSLIDQINKVESGFNADNPIPSTGPVTLTITPEGAGAPPPSTLKTTVPITFQLR